MMTAVQTEPATQKLQTIEPLLGIEEAARILGQTHWTLRHFIREGRIRGVRIGRRLMIEPCEIRRFIEEARASRSNRL